MKNPKKNHLVSVFGTWIVVEFQQTYFAKVFYRTTATKAKRLFLLSNSNLNNYSNKIKKIHLFLEAQKLLSIGRQILTFCLQNLCLFRNNFKF